ncbi:NHRF1 protein, partial [Circaetus pectoralis]|nr:NHRF1 protein [Circaetus pectoralis]
GSSTAGPAARLCRLERGPDGYGFHLHGEKGKPGQFIRLVEAGSPAERSGLRAGDRLLEVDGENVERESHQQVVERIRAAAGAVSLLVVDPVADEQLQKRGGPGTEPALSHRLSPLQEELRPRLCCMKKGPNGYGFNLHSDKSRPGQYVRAIDPDSPAEAAGLAPQDRIIEVCWGRGGLLAGWGISPKSSALPCIPVPGREPPFAGTVRGHPCPHPAGPLPEPVANGDLGKENGGDSQSNSVSESPSSPGLLAVSPDSGETHSEPDTQEGDKRHSASGSLLDLDIPLAVAKERAHQKRTSKRAPQMDWSKKNELFSNL